MFGYFLLHIALWTSVIGFYREIMHKKIKIKPNKKDRKKIEEFR